MPDWLEDIKKLQVGWDSYGAPIPNEDTFQKATMFSKILDENYKGTYKVLASVMGGIAISFKNDLYHIEFYNSGKTLACLKNGVDDEPEIFYVDNNVETYKELINNQKIINED